jgi:hypothetical protein
MDRIAGSSTNKFTLYQFNDVSRALEQMSGAECLSFSAHR